MTSDEPVESQGAPAESGAPASSAGGEPRPQGERRGRFSRGARGGRGRRGGGGGGGRRDQRPPAPSERAESPRSGPPGSIRQATELAGQIQSELERALEDINEILRILEQAEREKNASEDEIERLHESLHRLQQGRGPARPMRYSKPAAEEPSSHSPEIEKHEPEPEAPGESETEEGDERS